MQPDLASGGHPLTIRRLWCLAETVTIAAAGVGCFMALGLPLPFLFGPLSACLLAALFGRQLAGHEPASIASRTVIGVTVGASLTPALIAQLPQMAISVAFVPLYILSIGLLGIPFFLRVYGFDRATAWYAAMPGGLQEMVTFGVEAGGNLRALSLIHATRILVVVALVPVILNFGMGATLTGPTGAPASTMPLSELVLMAVAAVGGWWLGKRVGLPGASILGPLIVAAVLSLAGLITFRPPQEVIVAAQFVIGVGIGSGYVGITLGELRRDVAAGVLYVLVLAMLAALFTWGVNHLGVAPPLEVFLAFAPGGQAEMAVLALAAGADIGFVVLHHLVRIFLVIVGAPLAARTFLGIKPHGHRPAPP